jgi:signal transduction histidine kinase
MMINYDLTQIIMLAAVSLINGAIAYVVLRKNSSNTSNLYFAVLVLLLILWSITNYLCDYPIEDTLALFWNRITFSLASLMILFFYLFSISFPKPIVNNSSPFLAIPVMYTLFLSGASLFSDKIIARVEYYVWGTNAIPGPGFFLFVVELAVLITAGFAIQVYRFTKAKGNERIQFSLLITGLILSSVSLTISGVILPIITGLTKYGKYGIYSLLFFTIFTSYVIIAHRLFDIKFIIKRTLVYSVLLATILALYSLVIFLSSRLLGGEINYGVSSLLPNAVAAIFVALGFDPLKRWLSNITDQYLFKGEYDTQVVTKSLAKVLSGVVNLDEALESMMQIVTKEMRISKVSTLIVRTVEEGKQVKWVKSLGYSNVIKLEDRPIDKLLNFLAKKPNTIVYEEIRDIVNRNREKGDLIDVAFEMAGFQSAVAIPLLVDNKLIGILFVGEKMSGDGFKTDDLETLELIASQTTLSIEKAKFYEEDKLKSEFISIASHELLTPTAAIEGYLSMLLDKDIKPNAKQRSDYLQRAFDSSRRLADLVKDLLSVSRIESGRIKIVPSNIDLLSLVKQAVDELRHNAEEKKLKLSILEPKKAIPQVNADPDRIMQVCVNIINNAIKYTPKGEIKVSIELKTNNVTVSVADSGIGISKIDQRHLFEKFHRIDNPLTAGIMGTGLGLYIVKNIINLSGGEVMVESEPGRGSTFSFSLPIVK